MNISEITEAHMFIAIGKAIIQKESRVKFLDNVVRSGNFGDAGALVDELNAIIKINGLNVIATLTKIDGKKRYIPRIILQAVKNGSETTYGTSIRKDRIYAKGDYKGRMSD